MDIQQFLNDWWWLIAIACPAVALAVFPPIIRAVTSLMMLAVIISILRKQREQKKGAEPKQPVQPQGSPA